LKEFGLIALIAEIAGNYLSNSSSLSLMAARFPGSGALYFENNQFHKDNLLFLLIFSR